MAIREPVRSRHPLLGRLGLAAALLLALPAAAQDGVRVAQAEPPPAEEAESSPSTAGVEEIIVRGAESEALQDFKVADSVTAFNAADLMALGAVNVADLAAFTPNLEIVTGGATTPTFFIRGVGLNDFGANATSSVAIYQDDVPMNSQALQLSSLFDVENVNVLRGPQGSGLARNSSAGGIKLYGRKPTGIFNGYLRGETGKYDHRYYEGAIEAPVWEDMLSTRLAFMFTERNGTMENRCGKLPPIETRPTTGQGTNLPPVSQCGETVFDTSIDGIANGASEIPAGQPRWVNDRNNWAARGTVLFEPTLETSFLLNGHGTHRNEISRLGQSYGTGGFYCLAGVFERCGPGAANQYPSGTRIIGLLGGATGGSYIAPEVRHRLTDLLQCIQYGTPASNCRQPSSPNNANPDASDFDELDIVRQKVARELARDLDIKPWAGDFNRVGPTVNDTYGAMLKSEILLPGELELTAVSGYDRYQRKIDLDLDFSPDTLFEVFTRDNGWQLYQDVKIAGDHEVFTENPVRWDVGGWVLREALHVEVNVDLGDLSPFGVGRRKYNQDLSSYGGYGSFSFDFWDDFTLDGGVRYNWEKKDIDYVLRTGLEGFNEQLVPLNERDTWQDPTGTLRLTYRFREDTHAYWKYNRGWKPGHYNATGSPVSGITIAEPETIDAFETGLRAEWFGGHLSGDASLFYYRYDNYQIFTAQQFAGGSPEFVVLNANQAEVYGAEIDAVLRPPWQGGFLNVRFGWLETQFLDYLQIQQAVVARGAAQITINRELQNSGNPLLNSPQFKVSFVAEQAIPLWNWGYLLPRYDGAWTDTTYYDATKGRGIPNNQGLEFLPEDTIGQRAYWLHNVRLGYRTPDGRLEVAFWVRNAENKAYKTFAFDGSTFQSTTIYFVGEPRTYGLTALVTF